MNLAMLVADSALRAPHRTAIMLDDRAMTYRDLDDHTNRLAAYLAEQGVQPGDRVGIMLPNVPEFAVAYYGVLKAGGVVVPVNLLLKEREVAYYLRDSGATTLIFWPDVMTEALAGARHAGIARCLVAGLSAAVDGATLLRDAVAAGEPRPRMAQRAPDEPAVILYTSGTTGQPKGAQLTHSNLLWNAQISAELFGLHRDDVVLGTLPLFHSFGQTCALNAAMRRGATVALVPRFQADAVLELIERARVTVFLGVPTMYVALLNADSARRRDLAGLRLCASGGAPIPVEVLSGFEQLFGARVLEGYGLSETSPVASFNHVDRPSKAGSIGTPIWGTEMRLVDERGQTPAIGDVGEILVRGHHVMTGYWNRPTETAAAIDSDGWFRTGDMARTDEDGYFFIVDRKKELILRGGYNVYPREVEEVIYEHPAVLEAAVLGVPHAHLGEEVVAAVVPKPGAALDAAELQGWIKERVASYKYPRQVAVVHELPKGATGKILKREIDRGVWATSWSEK